MASVRDDYLDAAMRGCIVNMAKRNFGRIANFDITDLIQEGYVCYYKCYNMYVGKQSYNRAGELCRFLPPTNPDKKARKHLCSIVQRAFANRIATLVYKQPSGWEFPISSFAKNDMPTMAETWEKFIPSQEDEATAMLLLKSAPSEIKQLFDLLINDALDAAYLSFRRGKRSKRRETNNEYYCRLLGLPQQDLEAMLEEHFLKS